MNALHVKLFDKYGSVAKTVPVDTAQPPRIIFCEGAVYALGNDGEYRETMPLFIQSEVKDA